ncbi:MAG: HU family DNA-binding protein [Chlorobium sp.]
MIKSDLTEELAGLLDMERQEAASLFNGFCGAMVAELLAFRRLSVKGLGSFYVAHVPATKKSAGATTIFAPPINKLRFESTLSSGDETLSLAVSRLSMSQGEAARFARTLATLFSSAMQHEKEILLNGLGRFALEEGAYSFFPERTLEELLNREYQELKEVVLPHHEQSGSEKRAFGSVVPITFVAVLALLLALWYGKYSHSTKALPSKEVKSPVVQPQTPAQPRIASVTTSAGALASRSVADSLVLVKGDYAIVLATFESEKRALVELAPLRSAGINAFIWQASMDGMKYFRLMTGKFASREAAAEQLKGMPRNIVRGAYIQQARQTVVVYGKKGL